MEYPRFYGPADVPLGCGDRRAQTNGERNQHDPDPGGECAEHSRDRERSRPWKQEHEYAKRD